MYSLWKQPQRGILWNKCVDLMKQQGIDSFLFPPSIISDRESVACCFCYSAMKTKPKGSRNRGNLSVLEILICNHEVYKAWWWQFLRIWCIWLIIRDQTATWCPGRDRGHRGGLMGGIVQVRGWSWILRFSSEFSRCLSVRELVRVGPHRHHAWSPKWTRSSPVVTEGRWKSLMATARQKRI